MGLKSKYVNWAVNQQITDDDLNNISLYIKGTLEEMLSKAMSKDKPVLLTQNSVVQDTGGNYKTKISELYMIDTDGTILTNAEEKVVDHSTPITNARIDIIQIKATTLDQNVQSRQIIDKLSGAISTASVATEKAFDIEILIKEGAENITPIAPTVDSGYRKIGEVFIDTTGGIANADIFNVDSSFGENNTNWTTEKDVTISALSYFSHRSNLVLDHPDGSVTIEKIATSVWDNITKITSLDILIQDGTDTYIELDKTLKKLMLGDGVVDIQIRGNVTFDGTSTFTNTVTVNVGANKQLLNANITDNSQNNDAEFSVKRLDDETQTDRVITSITQSTHTMVMAGVNHGIVNGEYVQVAGATNNVGANNGEYLVSLVVGASITVDNGFNAFDNDEVTGAMTLSKQINAKMKWDETDGSWNSDFIGPNGEADIQNINLRKQWLADIGNIISKPRILNNPTQYRLWPLGAFKKATWEMLCTGQAQPVLIFYASNEGSIGNDLTVEFKERTSDGILAITAETSTHLEISYARSSGVTSFPTAQQIKDSIGTIVGGYNEFSTFGGYFGLIGGICNEAISGALSGGTGDVPADADYDYLRAFMNTGDPFDRSSGWNTPLRPRLPKLDGNTFARGVDHNIESSDIVGGGKNDSIHTHDHAHVLNNHTHGMNHHHAWCHTAVTSGFNRTWNSVGTEVNDSLTYQFGAVSVGTIVSAVSPFLAGYKFTAVSAEPTSGTAKPNTDNGGAGETQSSGVEPSNGGTESNLPPYTNVVYYIKY